jgi:hypothetical protein
MPKSQRALLSPDEEQQLRQLTAAAPQALCQRAQVVLDWHEGLTASQSAKHVGLTENQVRYLLRLYRQKGLDLFIVDEELKPAPFLPAAEPESPAPGATTLDALCAGYQVDMAHARHVVAQALTLFDAAMDVHRLTADDRTLLEAAGLVHNVAFSTDPARHDERGRDILLSQPIQGFSDDERRVLACVVAFHRKRVHANREPAYTSLSQELRHEALALAAILRVADGLDSTKSHATTITDVQVQPEEIVVTVDGPDARDAARQSQIKADLWNQVFTTPIRIIPAVSEPPVDVMPDLSPGLNVSMSVIRAGRTFALHSLDRLDALMKRVHSGDMGLLPSLAREASRLNEAIVLADAKDFRKETRWLLDTAEEARLAIALVERAALFADDPEEPQAAAIAAKIPEWRNQVQASLRALDMRRYTKIAADLRMTLSDDVDPNETSLIAFHVGSILWEQLAALRDVMENSTSVLEALEAARRLQDHLIAFRDLLGREVSQVLDMLSPFEGYLSAIRTTQAILMRLETEPVKKGRKTVTPPMEPAIDALHATQREALDTLADGLPATWSAVNNSVFRRAFGLAVAVP